MNKIKTCLAALLIASFALGAVYAQTQEKLIVMLVGSSNVLINGELKLLSETDPNAIPEIVEDRAYVPRDFLEKNLGISLTEKNIKAINVNNISFAGVRAVAEAFGFGIYYDNGLIILSSDKNMKSPSKALSDSYRKKIGDLPVVGSKEKMKELLEVNEDFAEYLYDGATPTLISGRVKESTVVEREQAAGAAAAPSAAPSSGEAGIAAKSQAAVAEDSSNSDFSATNVQVEGVDEGDIIKTDGQYIYYASGNKINIVKALPADKMEVVSVIEYDLNDYVLEMLLGDKQLIVFTASHNTDDLRKKLEPQIEIYDMSYGKSVVRAYIYNTANMAKPAELKMTEIDGSFVTARKVRSELYFITSSYSSYNPQSDDFALPALKDGSRDVAISYKSIAYFPESINYRLTNIVGIKLDNLTAPASVKTYLGGGDNIYMSADNLYIATESYTNYHTNNNIVRNNTNVYKFALNGGAVAYAARARVEGSILNQFSMDEHNTFFRIATTSWSNNSYNNLFVLDKDLNPSGSVKNIAPGERIYSVRFMGDKAYMVTFVQTDPLFVIDLKDPKNPQILGELKIPGYSNYLHPYGENHLMGFGIDTVVKNGTVYNRGMKISMFDVTDLKNPKELFVSLIGDRGTDSELLRNHRALLFDKNKDVLAFPVSVHMVPEQNKNDVFAYGELKFQGAYVYSVDLSKGFALKGQITHAGGDLLYDYNAYVNRIIYIGDTLYSVSNNMIKANSIKDTSEISSVKLK